jgi:hypothetical protein
VAPAESFTPEAAGLSNDKTVTCPAESGQESADLLQLRAIDNAKSKVDMA